MAYKHMKSDSSSLATENCKLNTQECIHTYQNGQDEKCKKISNTDKDVEQLEFSYTVATKLVQL